MSKETQSIENHEMEKFANTYGVGTIVLNNLGEILVGTEQIKKEKSNRGRGQLSIPMETLKDFERKNLNALCFASLTEITTEENICKLRESLKMVDVGGPIILNEKGLDGAIVVMRWVGSPEEMPFLPATPDEFNDFKWTTLQGFVNSEIARPYAITLVDYALSQGFLSEKPYREFDEILQFSPEKYNKIRDLYSDVK